MLCFMYLQLSSFLGHTLFVFTGLLGYSTGIHKIYVKIENEYQKSQSVASSGKADEIFMIKIV